MPEKKQPICRECKILFKTWNELAKHIVANQDTHPSKSVMFAYHVLSEVDNVKEFKPRQPMSDELKQAVRECVRELSGETKKGLVKCPQCKQLHSMEVEIEYIQDDNWRDDEGRLIILCGSCRESYRMHKKLVGV
jgi:hypothetical protein